MPKEIFTTEEYIEHLKAQGIPEENVNYVRSHYGTYSRMRAINGGAPPMDFQTFCEQYPDILNPSASIPKSSGKGYVILPNKPSEINSPMMSPSLAVELAPLLELLEKEQRTENETENLRELLNKKEKEFILEKLIINDNKEILIKLLKESEKIGYQFEKNAICESIKKIKYKLAKSLMEEVQSLTLFDENGSHALHYAAAMGNARITSYLFKALSERGDNNISPKDKNGKTPFIFAVKTDDFEMIELFLRHPAFEENPNPVINRNGETLVEKAILHHNTPLVTLILPSLNKQWEEQACSSESSLWKIILKSYAHLNTAHDNESFCTTLEKVLKNTPQDQEAQKEDCKKFALSCAISADNNSLLDNIFGHHHFTLSDLTTSNYSESVHRKIHASLRRTVEKGRTDKRRLEYLNCEKISSLKKLLPDFFPIKAMPDNQNRLQVLQSSYQELRQIIETAVNRLRENPHQGEAIEAVANAIILPLAKEYAVLTKEFLFEEEKQLNTKISPHEERLQWIIDYPLQEAAEILSFEGCPDELQALVKPKYIRLQYLVEQGKAEIKQAKQTLSLPPSAPFDALDQPVRELLGELIVLKTQIAQLKALAEKEKAKKQTQKIVSEIKEYNALSIRQQKKIAHFIKNTEFRFTQRPETYSAESKEQLNLLKEAFIEKQQEISRTPKLEPEVLLKKLSILTDFYQSLIGKATSIKLQIEQQEANPAPQFTPLYSPSNSLRGKSKEKKSPHTPVPRETSYEQAGRQLRNLIVLLSSQAQNIALVTKTNALLLGIATLFESISIPATQENRSFLNKSNTIRNAIFHNLINTDNLDEKKYQKLYQFSLDICQSPMDQTGEAILDKFFKIFPKVPANYEAHLNLIEAHINRLALYYREMQNNEVNLYTNRIEQFNVAYMIALTDALLSDLDKLNNQNADFLGIEIGKKYMRIHRRLHLTLSTLNSSATAVRHRPDAIQDAVHTLLMALGKALSLEANSESKEGEEVPIAPESESERDAGPEEEAEEAEEALWAAIQRVRL